MCYAMHKDHVGDNLPAGRASGAGQPLTEVRYLVALQAGDGRRTGIVTSYELCCFESPAVRETMSQERADAPQKKKKIDSVAVVLRLCSELICRTCGIATPTTVLCVTYRAG